MAASSPLPGAAQLVQIRGRDSRHLVVGSASNEFVFGVVGHVGSGTSFVAKRLHGLLNEASTAGHRFSVEILKARKVIEEWATARGRQFPSPTQQLRLADVEEFQNLGDAMRSELTANNRADFAAVAKALIIKIREARAKRLGQKTEIAKPVIPDGTPCAYILDSIRHPEEVNLLRRVYGNAFVLVGVVCEEERRVDRITTKYRDAGKPAARDFMKRDASASEPSGQHVSDAFYLGDFFIDNTADQEIDGKPNPAWDMNEHLSRLVKILTHSELVRPEVSETAMHHAQSARMRSACLSRQVGAALVDKFGNLVATGTNEVPRAGGGVYGERFDGEPDDARCAMHSDEEDRFCRNTRTQNEIVEELISSVAELKTLGGERRVALARELKRTQIGGLIEFSRAVHAEMDAILSAARIGASPVGTRLFVTTFPCHYCARHIVSAGIDEVQYIEPYPKSRALKLHSDAIKVDSTGWSAPSESGTHVLFRPFSGVAPRMYKRAFMKDRSLKDDYSGKMEIGDPEWGEPWHLAKIGYPDLEVEFTKEEEPECSEKIPPTATR